MTATPDALIALVAVLCVAVLCICGPIIDPSLVEEERDNYATFI